MTRNPVIQAVLRGLAENIVEHLRAINAIDLTSMGHGEAREEMTVLVTDILTETLHHQGFVQINSIVEDTPR